MPGRLQGLYRDVTRVIHAVNQIEDQKSPEARCLHAFLSYIEEEIADLVPESELEGKIARRGAVRAAVNSGDRRRALVLAASFIVTGSDARLAQELEELAMNN